MKTDIIPLSGAACVFGNVEKGYVFGPIIYTSKYHTSVAVAQEFQQWMKEKYSVKDVSTIQTERLMRYFQEFVRVENITYHYIPELYQC